ncbi:MAG: hypothetical protein HQK52_12350 [Oligoflexia bacterium]|nr:hypothetical protein [Oligoflexia bacterium]
MNRSSEKQAILLLLLLHFFILASSVMAEETLHKTISINEKKVQDFILSNALRANNIQQIRELLEISAPQTPKELEETLAFFKAEGNLPFLRMYKENWPVDFSLSAAKKAQDQYLGLMGNYPDVIGSIDQSFKKFKNSFEIELTLDQAFKLATSTEASIRNLRDLDVVIRKDTKENKNEDFKNFMAFLDLGGRVDHLNAYTGLFKKELQKRSFVWSEVLSFLKKGGQLDLASVLLKQYLPTHPTLTLENNQLLKITKTHWGAENLKEVFEYLPSGSIDEMSSFIEDGGDIPLETGFLKTLPHFVSTFHPQKLQELSSWQKRGLNLSYALQFHQEAFSGKQLHELNFINKETYIQKLLTLQESKLPADSMAKLVKNSYQGDLQKWLTESDVKSSLSLQLFEKIDQHSAASKIVVNLLNALPDEEAQSYLYLLQNPGELLRATYLKQYDKGASLAQFLKSSESDKSKIDQEIISKMAPDDPDRQQISQIYKHIKSLEDLALFDSIFEAHVLAMNDVLSLLQSGLSLQDISSYLKSQMLSPRVFDLDQVKTFLLHGGKSSDLPKVALLLQNLQIGADELLAFMKKGGDYDNILSIKKEFPALSLNQIQKLEKLPGNMHNALEIISLFKQQGETITKEHLVTILKKGSSDEMDDASYLQDLIFLSNQYAFKFSDYLKLLEQNSDAKNVIIKMAALAKIYPTKKIGELQTMMEQANQSNPNWNFTFGTHFTQKRQKFYIPQEQYFKLMQENISDEELLLALYHNQKNPSIWSYFTRHYQGRKDRLKKYFISNLRNPNPQKKYIAARMLASWYPLKDILVHDLLEISLLLQEQKLIRDHLFDTTEEFNRTLSFLKKSFLKDYPIANAFAFLKTYIRNRECFCFPQAVEKPSIKQIYQQIFLEQELAKVESFSKEALIQKGSMLIHLSYPYGDVSISAERDPGNSFDASAVAKLAHKEGAEYKGFTLSGRKSSAREDEGLIKKALEEIVTTANQEVNFFIAGHGSPDIIRLAPKAENSSWDSQESSRPPSFPHITEEQLFLALKAALLLHPHKAINVIIYSCFSYDFVQNIITRWKNDPDLKEKKVLPPNFIAFANKNHSTLKLAYDPIRDFADGAHLAFNGKSFLEYLLPHNFSLIGAETSYSNPALFYLPLSMRGEDTAFFQDNNCSSHQESCNSSKKEEKASCSFELL